MCGSSQASESGPNGRSDRGLWLLVRLNRWLLAAATLLGTFLALVGLSLLELTPLRLVAAETDPIETILTELIGAIITGTAIVVTINQLVLAQELGAVGDQYERMREARSFRADVEEVVDPEVSATDPGLFLADMLTSIEASAEELGESVTSASDGSIEEELVEYAEALATNARRVRKPLSTAEFGTFGVIWYALQFNYSREIQRGRQLRAEYADFNAGEMARETDEAFAETIERLTLFGPAREHFKTLYFQWELINLSRAMLYLAIPALVILTALVMFVDPTAVSGQFLGVDTLVWLTSAGFTVGIAPFVVFIVYILRVVTVAKATLAMGPFVLQQSKQDE